MPMTKQGKKDDLERLAEIRPYLRSALAFLLYMRIGHQVGAFDNAYSIADAFLARFIDDIESNK